MPVQFKKSTYFHKGDDDYHVLTYAEEGFAPLTIHGRRYGIDSRVLRAFADTVNARDETGTLSPTAPISAVPRRLIRDTNEPAELAQFLVSFMETNEKLLLAKTLVFDFRTPSLALHARHAIEVMLGQSDTSEGAVSIVVCE